MNKENFSFDTEKVKLWINKLPYIICIIGILTIIIRAFISSKPSEEAYLVRSGEIENTYITDGIIIKDESIIVRDTSKNYISVINTGERVSNNAIIATYKTEEYESYLEKLEQMDNEILQLMQDLPKVYSSETQNLVNDVNNVVNNAFGSTSYLDMQISLNTSNSILAKKADIIADSTETGSVIKELIDNRNQYIQDSKNNTENIVSTKSGIVSYQTDNLENLFDVNSIKDFTFDSLKEKLSNIKNTGNIKIVNNYEAYICVQLPIQFEDYINQNKTYKLKIIETDEYIYSATIERVNKNPEEEIIDIFFIINSGIENLINLRECQVEIIWWSDRGMYVPSIALIKDENLDIDYVQILKYAKIEKVPIIVDNNNGTYAAVRNYEWEQLEQLGINREYKLQIYDRLIID